MKAQSISFTKALHHIRDWLHPAYRVRRLGLAATGICLIAGWLSLPVTGILLIIGLTLLVYYVIMLYNALHFIDAHIRTTVGKTPTWPVHQKLYPLYKFVDLHRAARMFAGQQSRSAELCSAHPGPLGAILGGRWQSVRNLNTATLIPRKIGYEQDTYLPVNTFWLVPPDVGTACVVRLQVTPLNGMASLEVATPLAADATRIIDAIGELATQHSIYRNHMIRVIFGPEVPGDYDDEERMERMDLVFYNETPIANADIVMDDAHWALIDRTIVDFHTRRTELLRLGLPSKRGVLFYGPPGTGKTYTCKYIAQHIGAVTTIVVTGHALLHMKSICAVAKTLQPALVLLEDVDLVFSNREQNAYNTVLGEFIDQLDGFGETDQIIFILTTNAIDRIESAIKDRPGRISQCTYFGPPNAALRRRYLDTLVQPYESDSLNLPQIVGKTEGVSQAFLKELVFRAVQIASRMQEHAATGLRLSNEHFITALNDMTSGGQAVHKIIGFRMDVDR